MAINQSQIEKPVSSARAYGATRLILFGSAMESPAAIVDQIILLVTTMVQQQRTSLGIREDSPNYEIDLEHLLNRVALP